MKKNISLQKRDIEIIEFLEAQRFATLKQIRNLFFSSSSSCYKRLSYLLNQGFVSSFSVKDILRHSFRKRSLVNLKKIGVQNNIKIYTPKNRKKKLMFDKFLLHQLIVNEVALKLKEEFSSLFILFEKDFYKFSSYYLKSLRKLRPDFSLEGEGMKIAVEVETSLKSKRRYFEKIHEYKHSIYTHVLYIYLTEHHRCFLQEILRRAYFIALAKHSNPMKVENYFFGYLPLKDWIKKTNERRKNEKK